MSNFGAVNFKDESGVPYGIKHVNNKPRVSSMPYLYDIAEGNVTGQTRQRQFIYTVPLTKTLYITSFTVSGVNAAAGHWCRFTLRANYDDKAGATTANIFMPFCEPQVVDQSFTVQFDMPLKFPATTDIRVQAISDGGSANEICSCEAEGWVE